jgi:hypothetical protein
MAESSVTADSNSAQPAPIFNIPHMNHSPSIKLAKDSYMAWQFHLLAYLRGQDVYGFIDGTIPAPAQLIANPTTAPGSPAMIANPDYLSWYQKDQLMISVMVSTLSDSYVSHVVGYTTFRALWELLEKMFASQAHACIMQVHFQLATLKKGNSSVTNYFHKLKTLSDTLAACGQPLNDFEVVSFLLAGLGSEFDPLVTFVTTRIDPISRNDIYGLLLAHEMRLEHQMATTNLSNATAHVTAHNTSHSGQRDRSFNVARGRGFPNGRGYRSTLPGGRGSSFDRRGRGQQSHGASSAKPICQICNKLGHYANTYYQRFDQSSQNDSQSPLQDFYSSPNLPIDDSCYPDLGATHHLTHDLNNLTISSDAYTGSDQIHVGNGTGLSINHIGSARISCPSRSFILKNLLHVPSMCKKLLSISKFAHDNFIFFEFHSSFFVIKDCRTKSILHQGPLKHGLYQLLPSLANSTSPTALLGERTSAEQWHKCLGHPALHTVKHVISKFSLPVSSNKSAASCVSCQQAKAHQLPFPTSSSIFTRPLELLFSEVWGPSPVVSSNGNKYYVTFIDAFSKFTWLFPIQCKFDVFSVFNKFLLMVERLFNTKIQQVQTNWGREFRSLNTFFHKFGIIHRVSCPHTHQQQGCVERKHRHIIDTTLALLAESHVPKPFWDEACQTS